MISISPGVQAPGLRAEGLVVLRGERLVLDGVSFAVPPGGALLLTGPNGAGKSTLLRVLAGLVRAQAGTAGWNGSPVAGACAYLGHQDALKPGLTLSENLRLAACTGGGDLTTALQALDLAPLAALPARLLSAGQKRRAALARLALSPAPVWLLDEPSLGLDAASLDRLGTLLDAHRAHGGVVVAATHVPLPLKAAERLVLAAPAQPPEGWL